MTFKDYYYGMRDLGVGRFTSAFMALVWTIRGDKVEE